MSYEVTPDEILRVKEKAKQPEPCPRCRKIRAWDKDHNLIGEHCPDCAYFIFPRPAS